MKLPLLLAAMLAFPTMLGAAQPQAKIPQNGAMKGFRSEFLNDFADLQKKTVDLAKSIPADKFNWRPDEGVRSISEVYAHIAGMNYVLATFLGEQPPADMPQDIEKITDKKKIVAELQKSFEYVQSVMKKTSDSDFDRPVTMFGSQTSVRGVYITILNHVHEHLGQSVAYARMNKVVPPWSR